MNIGFISTRFSGTDGVSLESLKWATIFEKQGHKVFWFSGRSDRDDNISVCIPEAHFGHPENQWINEQIWSKNSRNSLVTSRIHKTASYLADRLHYFTKIYKIDLVVPENVLTIPIHLPLGVAITQFLAETAMPAIAHHHDFYWERPRFSINAVGDFLDMSFPPRLPNITHTVINQAAQQQLALRKGLSSTLVPNVFNFEEEPMTCDLWAADVRKNIGLKSDDLLILQPTRIVPRKGIEHSIKLLGKLNNPKCKLIISHNAGDEGFGYQNNLIQLAKEEGVDMRIIANRVSEIRQYDKNGNKMYTLWDIYHHADLVTYPSLYEGFGNALLEAFYFKKPILANRYSIFIEDIEPKGFKTITMNGYISRETVTQVQAVLSNEVLRDEMVGHNYKLAKQYYSYSVLERTLQAAFSQLNIHPI